MEIAMCNLVLPPNWIIAKHFTMNYWLSLPYVSITSTLVGLIA